MADFMKVAKAKIDGMAEELNKLSQEIWSNPELKFNEHHAHEVLTDFLEKEGFNVERHFVLETAFRATFGCDNVGPNICIICEYDALPDIGHACGHNLIAECGAAAGIGVKAALEASGNKYGKVTVLGTPGEEGGGGKIHLIKANAFSGIIVAMMAHPSKYNVPRSVALSMTSIFSIQSAGIFTNGGAAPSIIPDEAELTYYLRALDEAKQADLKKKVKSCAEGAAVATGCQVKVEYPRSYANLITNNVLVSIYEKHSKDLGYQYKARDDQAGAPSTDFGNVSHVVPGIHPAYSITDTASNHSHEFTAIAGSPEAQAPTLTQAKALAMTAIELLQPSSQDVLKKIQKEFKETVGKLPPPE